MRHLYINKEFFVLVFIFMLGVGGIFLAKIFVYTNYSLSDSVLFYLIMFGIMGVAIYLNTKSPMLIWENEDKFILQYEHKRQTIFKDEITALRYPVKYQKTLCYRIVVG